MISNFVMVSLSLYWFGALPVVSRLMIESSMCLICKKGRVSGQFIHSVCAELEG